MTPVLTFLFGAVRLLLAIIYKLIKTLGVIALVVVLTVLFVAALIVFFFFALAVQDHRTPITIGFTTLLILAAIWAVRKDRAERRTKKEEL